MPTVVARLEIGLDGNGVSASVTAQAGQLVAVGQAAAGLLDGDVGALDGLRDALAELQITPPELGGDLPGRFQALTEAVPTDLSSLTGSLLGPLETMGTQVSGDLVEVIRGIVATAEAIHDLTQVRFTCEDDGAGAGGGSGGGGGSPPPAPPAPGAPPPAPPAPPPAPGAPPAPPAPTPVESAADRIAAALDLLPEPLDVPTLLRKVSELVELPGQVGISIPVLDDLRDPLDTLVAWEGMQPPAVHAHLAASLDEARAFLDAQVNLALAPLARVAELAAAVDANALADIADGLTARLGELRAAVLSGDLSGTGDAVAAADALLDQMDALRPGLQTDVLDHLTGLEGLLEALPDDLEDALEHVGSVLRPPGVLPVPAPPETGEGALAGLEQFLDEAGGWLQDVVDRLDVSAIQGPVSDVAQAARDAAAALDGALVQLRLQVQSLFGQVGELLDEVDVEALRLEVEAAIDRVGQDVSARLRSVFAPVRSAVTEAVGAVDGAVDGFDPSVVRDALQGVLDTLEGVLGDPAVQGALQEVRAALETATAALDGLSFAPVTDEVIAAIDDLKKELQKIDPAQIPAPAQMALEAALAVLPSDLSPVTDPLADEFAALVEAGPVALVETVRAQALIIRDRVEAFAPSTLVAPLSAPYRELVDQLDAWEPGSLLEVVETELDALKDRLRETADPGQAVAPLEPLFAQLLAAFDALDPAAVIQPVEDAIEGVVDQVLDALPVDEALGAIDGVFGLVERVVRSADRLVELLRRMHDLLEAFGDAPEALAAWIDGIVAKIEAPGDFAAVTAALGTLAASVDGTRAAALTARLAAATDGPLAALAALNGPVRVTALVQADAAFPRAALAALPPSAEKTAVLSVLSRLAPASPGFAGPYQRLAEWRTAVADARAALQARLAGWDAEFHAPGGALDSLRRPAATPAQLRAEVRAELQAQFVQPVAAIFALAEPMRVALASFLSRLEPLVTGLTSKVEDLLLGPDSLHAVSLAAQEMVDTLRGLDLAFVREGLAALFAEVRGKLTAVDPAHLRQALSDAFADMLDTLSLSLLITPAEAASLDASWQQVVDKLRLLDPEAIVAGAVDPFYQDTVLPLLTAVDVTPFLEALADRLRGLDEELRGELQRVGTAFTGMLAAIPSGGGALSVSVEVSF